MTRHLTNAEAIVLSRAAEFELGNQEPASIADVAHDEQDAAALVGLAQKDLIDLEASYVCLTDAGIKEYERMVQRETGRCRINPFYETAA
jgi:hypothetical protein